MPLPIAAIASALLSGPDAASTPDTVISGFRDVSAGGINVGSKVVGSGSASTTIPPVSVNQGATGAAPVSLGSGLPSWLPIAAGVAAVLALLFLLIPSRKRSGR